MSNHLKYYRNSLWAGAVLVFGLLAFVSARPATAQCLDYSALSHPVDRIEYWQPFEQVVVAGDVVYTAAGSWIVSELSGTGEFENTSIFGSVDQVHAVAFGGDFSVTSTPDGRVDFRLATTSPHGATFGTVNTPGSSVAMAVDGGYVYVADAPGGLVTTNAYGLTGPKLESMAPGPPGGALDVDVGGGLAAVVGAADLWIYDLAMPNLPIVIGQVALPAGTTALDLEGDRVYVVGVAGLQIWDVSVPSSPQLLGNLDTSVPLISVRSDGNQVLTPAADGTLLFIDVSSPPSPAVSGSLVAPGIRQVDLAGDFLVAACGEHGLLLLDPGTVESSSALAVVPHGLGLATDGFAIGGDWGWLLQQDGGFQVIDLRDPALPVPGAVITAPSPINDLELVRGVLYAATDTGLRVYGLADPASPVDFGEKPYSWPAESIGVKGSTVYVIDSRGKLRIYDATYAHAPVEVNSLSTGHGLPLHVVCSGDLAYIGEDSGVWFYDISDPQNPAYITNRGGLFIDFVVRDELFIGLTTDNELLLRDHSNPASPVILADLAVGDEALSFTLAGDIVYVSCAAGFVRTFDISDPSAVAFYGDLAFISGANTSYRFPYLYAVTEGTIVVQELDCTSVAALDCDTNGEDDSVEIAAHPARDWNGDGVLDACQQGQGLSDVPDATAKSFVLRAAYPNPFNPHTTIAFDLIRGGSISLEVFDTAGHLVRRLAESEQYSRGPVTIGWDGRDGSRRPVPSGAYSYRLRVGGESAVGRLVLLK